MSSSQVSELLKKSASVEGFAFIRDGKDPNLDILTFGTVDHKIQDGGVRVVNERDPFPQENTVISYVMTLKHIKPADAVELFSKTATSFDPSAYRSIAMVPNASALIITDRSTDIRKLIAIKEEIDKP